MNKEASVRLFLGLAVVVAGLSFITILLVSYTSVPQSDVSCLSAQNTVSLINSPYACYDDSKKQSSFSVLFKEKVDGVTLTFDDGTLAKIITVREGEGDSAFRALNGRFGDPVFYSADKISTFVYSGGSVRSVRISPIVGSKTCGVSDSRVLEPCSADASSSVSVGESFISSGSSGGSGGSSGGSGPSTGNQVPIAFFTANTTQGTAPLTVLFNATLSTDPDGSIVNYSWNFGDGMNGDGKVVDHLFSTEGLFDVVLTVTDNGGATGTFGRSVDTSSGSTQSTCGNGIIQSGETCDDSNTDSGDGCSSACNVENGWMCSGQPSVCNQVVCGNGIVETGETCDDNNTISGDGCNSLCEAETGTCSDGLDNNGDGLVDWSGGDLDCANSSDSEGSTPSGSLKNNWTVFHPSADSRIVYVSQSTGNDANDGLSASTPKKTVAAGAALIRNQYDYPYNATRYPDWLLLKRGDSWNEGLGEWAASGRSNTERVVISSYGTSAERPLLKLPNIEGVMFTNYFRILQMDNIAVIGIAMRPHNQFGGFGNTFGVSILGNCTNILFEGNSITGFQSNMIIQTGQHDGIQNFQIRNNVIADTVYMEDITGHSQGIIASNIDGLLIEGNVMDNNGNLPLPFPTMMADYPDQNITKWAGVSDGTFNLLYYRWNATNGPDGSNDYLSVPVHGVNLVGSTSFVDIASRLNTSANSFAQPNFTISISSYVYPYNGLTYFLLNSTDNLSPINNRWNFYGVGPYTGAHVGGKDLVELNWSKSSLFNSCKHVGYVNRTYCGSWMQRNVFSQNMYITVYNDNVTVRGNIVSRPGHNGLQLRSGGITENNLFIQNPLAMFSGGVSPITITRNNVVLEGIDLNPGDPRSFGIDVQESGNATVENNIVAHSSSAYPYGYAYSISGVGEGATNLNYRAVIKNNIAYDWKGVGLSLNFGNASNVSVYQSVYLNVSNNAFQEPVVGILAYANPPTLENLTALRLFGNTYYSASAPSNWFGIYGFNSDYDDWIAATGETGSQASQISYIDPDRSVSSYNALQGKPATYDSFMQEARKQSRATWRNEYTADAVNQYIRDGFAIGGGRPGDGGCGEVGCSPLSSPVKEPVCGGNRMMCMVNSFRSTSANWARLAGYAIQESTGGEDSMRSPASFVLFLLTMILFVVGLIILVNYIRYR